MGSKFGREVHINLFSLKSFENRIRTHDYLLASILDDSSFIFGDEDAFFEGKKGIFTSSPSMDSVKFNMRMGLKMLDHAEDHLRKLLSNGSILHSLKSGVANEYALLGCLRGYHLGFGYVAAGERMKQLNRAISLRQLLTLDDFSFVKDLILVEKSIIRNGAVNLEDLKDSLNHSKSLLNTSKFPSRIKIS